MKRKINYKKYLVDLTKEIVQVQNNLDIEFSKPSSFERGKRIAKIMNVLSIANQSAMHFGLGYSFSKIKNLYNKETVK